MYRTDIVVNYSRGQGPKPKLNFIRFVHTYGRWDGHDRGEVEESWY